MTSHFRNLYIVLGGRGEDNLVIRAGDCFLGTLFMISVHDVVYKIINFYDHIASNTFPSVIKWLYCADSTFNLDPT